jgi:hypothetical protein
MQRAHDLILLHVNNGFGFASYIGDVEFMKRRCVRAAVWLGFSLEFLDDLYLFKINHSDGVVIDVGGVELLSSGTYSTPSAPGVFVTTRQLGSSAGRLRRSGLQPDVRISDSDRPDRSGSRIDFPRGLVNQTQ